MLATEELHGKVAVLRINEKLNSRSGLGLRLTDFLFVETTMISLMGLAEINVLKKMTANIGSVNQVPPVSRCAG